MKRANSVLDCSLPRLYYGARRTAKPYNGIVEPLKEFLDWSRSNARAGFAPCEDHDGNIWNASISPAIPNLLEGIA